jgi:hypothetical protein
MADDESCVDRDEQTPAGVIHITQDTSGHNRLYMGHTCLTFHPPRNETFKNIENGQDDAAGGPHHGTFKFFHPLGITVRT